MKPLFWVVSLFFCSAIARAQESADCEKFFETPVGNLKIEEIVKKCRKFATCGVDSQDMFNCVTPQVMSMLVFDAKEEDESYTYGALLEKLREYAATPSYVAFKKKQTELIKLLTVSVTRDNWNSAAPILMQNGFSSDDVQNLKTIYDRNPNDPWTYGDLMEYYNRTSPAGDNR